MAPMAMDRTLSGPVVAPAAGGAPRQLVILLHGVGADGHDLIGLAPYWARQLPHAEFVSPHAPDPCDMAPFGYQWFSLLDRSPDALLAGVQANAPLLDAFIDQELAARGLTDRQLALVGFSQGTIMALYAAPRRQAPCAAVVGYSGALVGAETLAAETRSHPPVLLIHGDADPVVSVQALPLAVRGLQGAGLPVRHAVRPGLAHGIDPEGLELGGAFIAEQFATAAG